MVGRKQKNSLPFSVTQALAVVSCTGLLELCTDFGLEKGVDLHNDVTQRRAKDFLEGFLLSTSSTLKNSHCVADRRNRLVGDNPLVVLRYKSWGQQQFVFLACAHRKWWITHVNDANPLES